PAVRVRAVRWPWPARRGGAGASLTAGPRGHGRGDDRDDRRGIGRSLTRGARATRPTRLPSARGRSLRWLLRTGGQSVGRGAAHLRPAGRSGLDRHRPAQARAAALRVRLRAVPRSHGGPVLQARLALYVLLLTRAASGRDQPGVLPTGRRGRGAVGHAAALPPRAGRRVRPGARPGSRGSAGAVREAAGGCEVP